jgi:iron complex transport system substrate-binding protein
MKPVAAGLFLIASVSMAAVQAVGEPQRIVSFNICADQLVVALADPNQIAALSPYATDPVLSVVAEQAKRFRRVDWQAESTVPLNPDLVLVGPSDRSITRRMLTGLGYRVVEVDLITDLPAAQAQIRSMAALLGHPARGEALFRDVEDGRRRLAAAPQPPSSTALLVGHGGYTAGPHSLAAALIAEAGLVPPPGAPKGYGGFVPLEKLIALRPDFLVFSDLLEEPKDQGAVYLTHPALRRLYPPERRILLPTRFSLCGGPSLVAALDYLAGVITRLPPIQR